MIVDFGGARAVKSKSTKDLSYYTSTLLHVLQNQPMKPRNNLSHDDNFHFNLYFHKLLNIYKFLFNHLKL